VKAPRINTSAGEWGRRHPELRQQFLVHAHRLLAAGAARLDRSALPLLEEPAITGRLCTEIQTFLVEPDAPPWCEKYACHDDPPVNDSGKEGRARDRADLKIEMTVSPRPEFYVEAKRLRLDDRKAVPHYVDKDGMGCFIEGRYARAYDFGAMLGYIVSGNVDHWVQQIEERLLRDRHPLKIAAGPAVWCTAASLPADLATRSSRHVRDGGDAIELFHSFMVCHAQSVDTP
jgi:hypothetical protein